MDTRERKPLPHSKAFLLCEKVITEENTRHTTIVSAFNNIIVPRFPAEIGPFVAFLHMTDGIGEYDGAVAVYDLALDKIIGHTFGFLVSWPTRLASTKLVIRIPPLTLTHAGLYDVIVLLEGQELERQQFGVTDEYS